MLVEELDSTAYSNAMINYRAALEELNTKLHIINTEFSVRLNRNPIESIKSRLKSPQSITRKLIKKGLEPTIENAERYLDDIAGIRIICSFEEDIYHLASIIESQPYIRLLKTKDYIAAPKESGYRSYHILAEVPVYRSGGMLWVRTEIQIRTMAMDFWASLEHKIRYKFDSDIPEKIKHDLVECSAAAAALDDKMYMLNCELRNTDQGCNRETKEFH